MKGAILTWASALALQVSATPLQSTALLDLEARQVSDRRCGAEFNKSCPAGQCCSSGGWCGTEEVHCRAPTCQLSYGPACDGNVRPAGPDTSGVARTKVGNVPYGKALYDCTVNGNIALTFDDGPLNYTADLLDLLAEYDVKATFFVAGRNQAKGAINDPSKPWPAIIKRMIADGHQIGSHTYSHQKLTEITAQQFQNQMQFNEIALADLLGYFPTYMRPPHSMSNEETDGWLGDLGYHITYFDLNTAGYENNDPALIQNSKNIWDKRVPPLDPKQESVLVIEHDTEYQTVYNLTEYMLISMRDLGWKGVTVGECLNDPKENWYRSVAQCGVA